MEETKRFSLIKPTLSTPFRIDFDWWQEQDRDWHVYLRSLLCEDHKEVFSDWQDDQPIDWIDPETAEVRSVDGLLHVLMSHCAKQDEFVTQHTALVEAVFRLLLSSGNQPMTVVEFAKKLNRPPETILRTISGMRVYRGMRPYYG